MEWTIGELAERATAALAPTARLNGRVRDVPNERLIRWYATIGLLDPPSARRGRVALYGRRHLLQLIAVKRRQADGRTIAEIQAELTGATDQTLESIARIPQDTPEPPLPPAARPRFWAEPASVTAETGLATMGPAPSGPRASAGFAPSGPAAPPPSYPADARIRPSGPALLVHGVRLADGVTLLLDGGGRAPSPDDLAEIAAASQELLSLLRERGLTPPEGTHP